MHFSSTFRPFTRPSSGVVRSIHMYIIDVQHITVIQDIFISENFHTDFFVQKIFIQDCAYENILKGHFPIVNNF